MGYRPPQSTYKIEWAEDHQLHGLVIMARGLRLGKMLDMAELYVSSGLGGKDDDELRPEDIEMMKVIFRLLVGNDDQPDKPHTPGVIMSWNREDDSGEVLPVSMDGIRELEMWEFQGIMDAYLQLGGVKLDDPLSEPSKNGKPSQEPSALTELESLSQLS
jgi:hypothetical protein